MIYLLEFVFNYDTKDLVSYGNHELNYNKNINTYYDMRFDTLWLKSIELFCSQIIVYDNKKIAK